jgi:hypothetical protein
MAAMRPPSTSTSPEISSPRTTAAATPKRTPRAYCPPV